MSAFLLRATCVARLAALYDMFAYLHQTFIWTINLAISCRVVDILSHKQVIRKRQAQKLANVQDFWKQYWGEKMERREGMTIVSRSDKSDLPPAPAATYIGQRKGTSAWERVQKGSNEGFSPSLKPFARSSCKRFVPFLRLYRVGAGVGE